ncbi:MAG TPA: hypothetical protein VK474_01285, partial [Chthoniobacterales bacterium]|nr:hypothetical protein [Chthoniobacterales bacterium]
MIKFFGGRLASAVIGISVLAGSSSASAQANAYPKFDVKAAVKALDGDAAARPLGSAISVASTLVRPAVASTIAIAVSNGNVFQSQPAKSVT